MGKKKGRKGMGVQLRATVVEVTEKLCVYMHVYVCGSEHVRASVAISHRRPD